MFDSAVLEVAIGMAVIYLVLSLAASVPTEAWLETVQRRGRLLHRHIARLIGRDAAIMLYADPRVRCLMSADSLPIKDRWILNRVLDHNYRGLSSPLAQNALKVLRGPGVDRLPSSIPETVFADVVLSWLRDDRTGLLRAPSSASSGSDLIPLRPDLIDAWNQLYRDAGADPTELHGALVAWLKHANDRLIGQFRRKTQGFLLMLGFGLAVLVDASTPHLMNRLFDEQRLRDRLVDVGTQLDAARASGTLATELAANAPLTDRFTEATRGLLWRPGDARCSTGRYQQPR